MLKNVGIAVFSTSQALKNKQQTGFTAAKQALNTDMFVKSSSTISFKETVSESTSPNEEKKLPAGHIELKGTEGSMDKLEAQRIMTSPQNESLTTINEINANNVKLVFGTYEVVTINTFDLPELHSPGEVVLLGNQTVENINATKAKVVNYESNPELKAKVANLSANNIYLGGNATVVDNVTLIGENAKLEIDSKPQVKVIDFSNAPLSVLVLSNRSNTETGGAPAKIVNGKEVIDFKEAVSSDEISLSALSKLLPGISLKGSAEPGLQYGKINKPGKETTEKALPYGLNTKVQTEEPEILVSLKPVLIDKLEKQLGIKIEGTPASITTVFEEKKSSPLDKSSKFKTIIYPVIRPVILEEKDTEPKSEAI